MSGRIQIQTRFPKNYRNWCLSKKTFEEAVKVTSPLAPEILEINNVQKNKGDSKYGVVGGSILINIVQLNPHGKLIERNTKGEAIE